jgi:uncharacterized membrane protein YgdD (TMEM256/DUF423 family)
MDFEQSIGFEGKNKKEINLLLALGTFCFCGTLLLVQLLGFYSSHLLKIDTYT